MCAVSEQMEPMSVMSMIGDTVDMTFYFDNLREKEKLTGRCGNRTKCVNDMYACLQYNIRCNVGDKRHPGYLHSRVLLFQLETILQ